MPMLGTKEDVEALPEQVRIQVAKMRELVKMIEGTPLNDVGVAIENPKLNSIR